MKNCVRSPMQPQRHLQVLQEALLVNLAKGLTENGADVVSNNRLGRKRYLDYLAVLEQVILDGRLREDVAAREKLLGVKDRAGGGVPSNQARIL